MIPFSKGEIIVQKKFNSIVNAISFKDLTTLKTADIRMNISAFARWIYKGHPSWPFWNKNVRNCFKQQIVDLYVQADSVKSTDELLKKLYEIALQTIPDRHFSVSFNHKRVLSTEERQCIKNKILSDLIINPQVGQNLAKKDVAALQKMGIRILMREDLSNIGKAWLFVGEINPKIGIVACTHLTTINPKTGKFSKEQSDKLAKMVKAVEENYPQWRALIIDLRDNHGGDSRFFQKIAEIVNDGRAQPIVKRLWIRNTPENIRLMYEKQKISQQFDEKRLLKLKGSEASRILWESMKPYLTKRGRKEIRVLINRSVQSSGEGALFQIGNVPTYKTVGENTGGCVHGWNPVQITLPNGGILNMATCHAVLPQKCPEGIGLKPDILTPKTDAFQVALKDIQNKLK